MTEQKAPEAGRQWLRECSLVVAGSNGQGLELGELRVVFKVSKGAVETPNSAEIRVYNPSEATANSIRREFSQVVLQAGYQGGFGIIFSGNIRQVRRGRENGTDTWLEIIAADGDWAYNYAVVNTTLAAGSTPADRMKVCQGAFSEKGVQEGHMTDPGGNGLPRGKVMYGMARKHMRDAACGSGCEWSFQDGKVQVVKASGYLPGEAVVLTHETGLIGTPEQTNEGIKVRCLLNPSLRIGGRIKLDNKSVQQVKTDLKMRALYPPRLDHDGLYRILRLDFVGDTRGNDWYADALCIGLDDTSYLPLDMVR